MKRIFSLLLVTAMIITVIFTVTACGTPEQKEDKETEAYEDLYFHISWGVVQRNYSYDSRSGKLTKTNDPDDQYYGSSATLIFSDEELRYIYELITELSVTSHPYKHKVNESRPSVPIRLYVEYGDISKTIICSDFPSLLNSEDEKARQFHDVCDKIINMITATDEWESIPETKHIYM